MGRVGKDSIELKALTKHFELYNRTEGKSARTIDWYNETISLFQRFLEGKDKLTNIGNLGELEVREFIIYLGGRRRWQDNPRTGQRSNPGPTLSVFDIGSDGIKSEANQ